MGAAASAKVADFFILHGGVVPEGLDCPDNVKMVDFGSTQGLANELVRVIDKVPLDDLQFPRDKLVKVITHLLDEAPYALVEWKMALGYVFQDILKGDPDSKLPVYSHWAYSDLDVVFGDLPRWITVDEYEFDIVTYGFGDQHRLYPRGQFTIHKNSPKVNQIWETCTFLSRLDIRWSKIVKGDKHYQFESAEGCYATAILQQKDVSVKYAVKAWTDQEDDQNSVHLHGVYLSKSRKHRGKHVLYKATSKEQGIKLTELDSQWFERDLVYIDRNQDMQEAHGERSVMAMPMEDSGKDCMYWIRKEYEKQICLPKHAVTSTDTVYYINGQLFKEPFLPARLETEDVVTAPFYHFQDWKRFYHYGQVANMHLSSTASTFVLTKEGSIPFFSGQKAPKLSTPLGQILKKDTWIEATDDLRAKLPYRHYCLISMAVQRPSRVACDLSTSWRDKETVHIVSGAPGWASGEIHPETDVTLVLTLQISGERHDKISDLMKVLQSNIDAWGGQPCVVVTFLAGAGKESIETMHKAFVGMKESLDNVLVAVISRRDKDGVSRKALMNMAIDAVPTRWYVQGLETERGLQVSSDTVTLVHRTAAAHSRYPGHLFWIPQFALRKHESTDVLISDILDQWHSGVHAPAEVEEPCSEEEDGTGRWRGPNEIWLEATKSMVGPTKKWAPSALSLENLQKSALELLEDETDLDESPILLVDNHGPSSGMMTNLMVRLVEALAGRQCFNHLQIAQLVALGHHLEVLPAAFAFSSQNSRSVDTSSTTKGDSRCDRCFLFEENDGKILQAAAQQEAFRTAKTAILWYEKKENEK